MLTVTERADLAYWFPRLHASGVAVPDTRIVATELDLDGLLEGDRVPGFKVFVEQLRAAALEVGGFPCFLRTGHGSDKYGWRRTCWVPSPFEMAGHVAALVEWSAMVDIAGLPTRTWAVRRLLQLSSSFTAFDGFPVNQERRYFIADGKVRCNHPYWPERAVAEGRPTAPNWQEQLAAMNRESPAEVAHLTRLSEQVAQHFVDDGAWSLDWALDEDGVWIAIDMAPAERSFHWAGCPHAPTPPRTP